MDSARIDRYIDALVERSTPETPAWNIEAVRQGKGASWNYIDGCMLTALLSMAEIRGEARYRDFVKGYVDYFLSPEGEIKSYDEASYNLDNINEGRVLFELYRVYGDEKYRLAAERLHGQLLRQPRTDEGSFWHKKIYPHQVWLDGIYMAQVFSALYEQRFGSGDCGDVLRQIATVRARMYDEEKGLCYHGYDCSRSAFWADPQTGLSKSFWLRSMGWLTVALADLCELLPQEEPLKAFFRELMAGAARYADPDSGMYYQVVDQGGREGNYLETSGSAMLAYAMLKGARLGILDKDYAAKGQKTFNGIVDKYLTFNGDALNLGGICLVAGLGPENNRRRDGSYEYYISEPVVENDAKGVAPFVLCYTEILRAR